MTQLTENITSTPIQLTENVNSKTITVTEVNGVPITVNENCTVVQVDYTLSKITATGGVSQTVIDRIAYLESSLFNIESYAFSVAINLIDNTEETYTVTITGVNQLKNYALIFNNSTYGFSADLNSWNADSATINVKNNSGTNINQTFNFKLQEILNTL